MTDTPELDRLRFVLSFPPESKPTQITLPALAFARLKAEIEYLSPGYKYPWAPVQAYGVEIVSAPRDP